ncbi:MAG: DUF454 family protein [Gammaproteobacteria bacterium]|nr:DUF454 family protein [Gammaproteobacteria bacterium]
MQNFTRYAGQVSSQMLIFIAIIACLALGLIGLLLPIIPGLLFLGIAAVLLAPYVPALGDWMRRSPVMRRYMDDAEKLASLPAIDRIKAGLWLSLRMLVDSARLLFDFIGARMTDLRSRSAEQHDAGEANRTW